METLILSIAATLVISFFVIFSITELKPALTNRKKQQAFANKESLSSTEIPYSIHADRYTVKTKNGDYIQVLKLDGASHETSDQATIDAWKNARNQLYKGISSPDIAIWTHLVKRESKEYPEGEFTGFAKQLNDKWREKMLSQKSYVTDLYITVVKLAPNSLGFGAKKPNSKTINQIDKNAVKSLSNITDQVKRGFGSYGAKRLSLYKRKKFVFSEISEFLNTLIDGDTPPLPLSKHFLDRALGIKRTSIGLESIEYRGVNSTKYSGILGIKEYADVTYSNMMDSVLDLPFEFAMSQSFHFKAKSIAVDDAKLQRDRMENADDMAVSQIDEIDDMLDDLASNKFRMGDHSLTLTAYGSTRSEMSDNLNQANNALMDSGLITAREDKGLIASYWSQLPGNFNARNRVAQISSQNFASLASFHNHSSGKIDRNYWGPAITMFKTTSGAPYYFNVHLDDLGNTTIIGPSGTGKTVCMGFIVCQMEKYKMQTVYFDKDRGAEILIRANGGTYLPIIGGIKTGFNPLQMEPSPENILFLNQWVKKLVTTRGETFTVADSQDVHEAIEGVLALPLEARRLKNLMSFVDCTSANSIGKRLEEWTEGNKHGWMFDNESDSLNVDNRVIGFDITTLLDDDEVRTACLMYLFHRVEKLIDGRRFGMFIDEGWKALSDEYFEPKIKDLEKTIRKREGFVVFGSNDAADATTSRVGEVIITQSPTKLFMPNPDAKEKDYIDGWSLSKKEFEIIKTLPKESRQFLIKHGNISVVAELNMAGMDDEIAVLSGRSETVSLLEEIRKEVGEDPQDWLPVFFEKWRKV